MNPLRQATFLLIISFVLSQSALRMAKAANEPILKTDMLGPAELEKAWSGFLADDSGTSLAAVVQKKGFSRQPGGESGWGFKGVNNQGQPVLMCVWSFEPKTAQERTSCAMIWVQQGRRQYKAYLTFPENMTDLGQAREWYANAKGTVELASSWHTCFRSKLNSGACETTCATRSSHNYCFPNAFTESYTFAGKVRLFTLRTYLDCLVARCADRASCLLSVALDCGYTD